MIDQVAFLREFAELCDKHGIADYAIVAHGLSGGEAIDWASGIGGEENLMNDRARHAKLHFNLSGLADEVLRKTWMPPTGMPELDPLEL